MILRYKIRCLTESADKYWYLPSEAPTPKTCPLDTAHAVDLSSVVVTQQGSPSEVVTQSEKNDKDKKIAKAKGVCQPDNSVQILVKIPGTPNFDEEGNPINDSENDRWINGGILMSPQAQPGDYIILEVLAPDASTVVKSYTEQPEEDDEKDGWYVDPTSKMIELVTPSPGRGFAGFYLRITYHAAEGGDERKIFLNIDWDVKV